MKYFVLAACFVVALAKHEVYQGWKSYFVGPNSKEHFKALQEATDDLDLDFLNRPIVGREGLVLVKPEVQEKFLQILNQTNIPFKVHSTDFKKILDKEDESFAVRRASRSNKNLPYDDYQEIEVIDAYLIDIAKRYSDKVKLVEAATTHEARTIRYLKISTTNFGDIRKPVIVIDGGIHAREWIAPPVVTWAIHKLVEDVTEPDLLEKYDWVLLPVANPDGYKYTFTTSRFWRKNRSTYGAISLRCVGVDGNRNYDFFWGEVGSSNNPCDDTYAGNKEFSEVETRVVKDILHEHLPRIAFYMTVHSYGSMVLYPWGHDGSVSNNTENLHEIGVKMANAIDAKKLPNFPNYVVGNAMLTLWYGASGASEDYAHSIGVPIAYTIELPGFGWSLDAFHLDPQYIQQVSIETWDGIVAGVRAAGDLFLETYAPGRGTRLNSIFNIYFVIFIFITTYFIGRNW